MDETNAFVRTQIIVVEPSSGSVAVINAGPQGPPGSDMSALLPLSPTDIGPGEPSPYAIYTDTGWEAPPTSNHIWSGNGWVLLSGANFGLDRVIADTYTTFGDSSTDVVDVDLGPVESLSSSDSYDSDDADLSITDGVTVTLT